MDNSTKKEVSTITYAITIVILFFILILLAILLIKQYITYTSDYVEKSYINTFYIEKSLLAFSDLPKSMRNKYITKSNDERITKKLNSNVNMIEKSTIFAGQNADVVFVKQMECSDFLSGSYNIPVKCKNFINAEFENLDDSMIFEIIPIVNNEDFEFFRLLIQHNAESDIIRNREQDIDNFIEYANSGLSVKRTNEAIWALKQYFGNKVVIRQSSFHMFTKGKAGFIIKAFNNIQ